jgi:GGDEF domain-containing protein
MLLPLFAVVLLVNAVFVVVALRALREARAAPTRHGQDPVAPSRSSAGEAEPGVDGDSAGPATTLDEEPSRDAPRSDSLRPIADPPDTRETVVAANAEPTPEPDPDPSAGPPDAAAGPNAATDVTDVPAEAAPQPARRRPADGRHPSRRGRRPKFALPPLDEDHERVSRSIASFLTGTDAPDAGAAAPSTVALVAIEGLAALADGDNEESADLIAATVERTLRGAARSSDRVTEIGDGRFRIVLPQTSELAARAYLRRVRATVEPTLESAAGRVRLVTLAASTLDPDLTTAFAEVERHLEVTLNNPTRRTADRTDRTSRAAGD